MISYNRGLIYRCSKSGGHSTSVYKLHHAVASLGYLRQNEMMVATRGLDQDSKQCFHKDREISLSYIASRNGHSGVFHDPRIFVGHIPHMHAQSPPMRVR